MFWRIVVLVLIGLLGALLGVLQLVSLGDDYNDGDAGNTGRD